MEDLNVNPLRASI